MSLESGLYQITSAWGDKPFVGRDWVEDLSLMPKRIITIPTSSQAPRPWVVQKVEDDRYILKATDAPTAIIDDKVFAVLLDVPPAEEWLITAVPQSGEDAYIIEKKDRQAGWVIPDVEERTQVVVRPLIVGPSYPPFYPPNQVFIIKPVLLD